MTEAGSGKREGAPDRDVLPASRLPLPREGRLLAVDWGVKRIGLAISDPTQTIAAPQARRPLPKILSARDLEAMLAAAAQDSSPEGLRLSLIVEMLYGGGLRVSELAGMPLAAVESVTQYRHGIDRSAMRSAPGWTCTRSGMIIPARCASRCDRSRA